MIETRFLTTDDAECIHRLSLQLNTRPAGSANPDFTAALQNVLEHPGTTMMGAALNDQIVAMVTLHILPNITNNRRPYALIENVVSDQAVRGQGAGRAVMQAAIDHARSKQAYKIMLLSGRANGAIGFYEKLGFSRDEKEGLILRLN